MNQFQCLGNDRNEKPLEAVAGGGKLGGNAVLNWCCLRLLPLLIGDKIDSSADNEVGQLISYKPFFPERLTFLVFP